jgi:hypothetical protein
MSTMRFQNRSMAMMFGACPLTLGSLPQASRGRERNSWSPALRARPDYFIGAETAEARV